MKFKRAVSGIILVLLLASVWFSAFNIPSASASGTVYIRADGSIDPPTASIQRKGDVYTLTGNITSDADAIVVERNNIVVDGGGYTVQGTGTDSSKGIDLHRGAVETRGSNVTIRNTNIKNFDYGIQLGLSNNNSIIGNTITNNNYGIYLYATLHNNIEGNNITNNSNGIYLINSVNNSMSENSIRDNSNGIVLGSSSGNNLSENTFTDCGLDIGSYSYLNIVNSNTVNGKPLLYLENVTNYSVGDCGQVILVRCSSMKVENLSLSNASVAIQLLETNNTVISRNTVTNNLVGGMRLLSSFNVSVSGNNITGNGHGIEQGYGIGIGSSSNVSVSGNSVTANYFAGVAVGYFSSNNSISGNDITANDQCGVFLDDISNHNNSISGNNITANNRYGISLYSSNNSIVGNTVANNRCGIWLTSNNTFYHNSFINNIDQVYHTLSLACVWDNGYPSGGNYWSDCNSPDTDKDKIGDTPYKIDSNNTDRYPLIYPFECYGPGYVCSPDLNKDGVVNIVDVSKVAKAFGCKPGDSEWDVIADMDLNEVINIVDVSKVAKEFGKEWKE